MKYLLPMARNTVTNETIKTQELNGVRYSVKQKPVVEMLATQLADRMTARTGDQWVGFVKLYSPISRSV
jgi:hypothetical protein